VLPLSALRGDNVTEPIDQPWYRGPSLLQLLEALPATQERVEGDLLLPVQKQMEIIKGVDLPATWLLLFNKVASKTHNGPCAVPVRSNRYEKKHGRIYDFGHRAPDPIS